jgi:hypothetical protein
LNFPRANDRVPLARAKKNETMTAPRTPQIALYRQWLRENRGLSFQNYEALRQWSVRDLDGFWQSIWNYFDLKSPTPHRSVVGQRKMPGAVWFPGAQVNYVRQVLRHVAPAHAAGQPAIIASGEDGVLKETNWPELKRKVAALALHLKAQGVRSGDRVAAYLPNIPETMIAFLATASLGAIWSVCAPDMAAPAVIDRFKQIEPRVLIACDSVVYAGRRHDRRDVVEELQRALPTVEQLVLHSDTAGTNRLSNILAATGAEIDAFEPEWLPFDHPLWIVYSSGTTGLPKPIVHGHGGIMIVGLPLNVLHNDIGCSYTEISRGERYHWYLVDRLDHVELPGKRPAQRHHLLHLRRKSGRAEGQAGLADAVALRRRCESDVLRGGRGVLCELHQGRHRHHRRRRSLSFARAGIDGLAARSRHAGLVQRAHREACRRQWQRRAEGHVVGQHVGRHGFRRRLHRRLPRVAAGARHHAVPPARRRGRSL